MGSRRPEEGRDENSWGDLTSLPLSDSVSFVLFPLCLRKGFFVFGIDCLKIQILLRSSSQKTGGMN